MLLLLVTALAADVDQDTWDDSVDCNDNDASIHPGAGESCEPQDPQVDDDCDGNVNTETDPTTGEVTTINGTKNFYPDNDGDSFGDKDANPTKLCSDEGGGWSSSPVDCDDDDDQIYPGQSESCNGKDDDCDGAVDNDDSTDIDPATSGCTDFWRDADLDVYGDEDQNECLCEEDICSDGRDNDNDGFTDHDDEDCGDGGAGEHSVQGLIYVAAGLDYVQYSNFYYITEDSDCYDSDALVYPGAPERLTGLDDDCDGRVALAEADCDGDEYRAPDPTEVCTVDETVSCWSESLSGECDGATGWVMVGYDEREPGVWSTDDCDDQDPSIHPDATEVPGDGIDQDCDGTDPEWVDTAVDSASPGDTDPPGSSDKGDVCTCSGVESGGFSLLALALGLLVRR